MTRLRTDIVALSAASTAGLAAGAAVALGASAPLAAVLAAVAASAGAGIGVKLQASPEAPPPEPLSPIAAPAQPESRSGALFATLDAVPAAIILLDDEARTVFANVEARRLFDGAAQGAPLAAAIRAPDVVEAVDATVADGVARVVDFDLKRASGERRVGAHVSALRAADDAVACLYLEDRTRARQIETVRETFLANASHELKTPLASIIGFIETLQGPARDDPKARERFLGIMAAQAGRMQRLVEDLISLNRIEMNVNVAPTERVNIGGLAHETAAALAPLAAEIGGTIEVETPSDGPMAPADRDQIAQLLTNLVDNALKYGGDGVKIRLRPAEPSPDAPGMTGVVVEDDGPGIAREHLPRLTERFYRVSAARSRAVGGTGLGLAIAKHILQRHRGRLAVASTPGEGSSFTIWLPEA